MWRDGEGRTRQEIYRGKKLRFITIRSSQVILMPGSKRAMCVHAACPEQQGCAVKAAGDRGRPDIRIEDGSLRRRQGRDRARSSRARAARPRSRRHGHHRRRDVARTGEARDHDRAPSMRDGDADGSARGSARAGGARGRRRERQIAPMPPTPPIPAGAAGRSVRRRSRRSPPMPPMPGVHTMRFESTAHARQGRDDEPRHEGLRRREGRGQVDRRGRFPRARSATRTRST